MRRSPRPDLEQAMAEEVLAYAVEKFHPRLDREQQVEHDRGLLLERAGGREAGVMRFDGPRQHLARVERLEVRRSHQATSTGSSRSVHHAGSVRPAKSRKVSPSSWLCS